MDYILELRQLVGSRPLIMVGATLLLLNRDDQLLMMRRTDNGCWGVPGGGMEPGETFEETINRESREEIGVTVRQLEFFNLYSGPDFHYIYPNGDEIYGVTAVYLAHNFDGRIMLNSEEHSEYCFFDISNLPENTSPPIKPILKDLIKTYGEK